MPKSMFYNENLTASAKTANLLAGDVNEFVPYDAIVTISCVNSAAGVRISVFADSDLLVDDKTIPFLGSTLSMTDHVLDQFEVEAGTRLAIFLRETAAAGTIDVYTAVEITPV